MNMKNPVSEVGKGERVNVEPMLTDLFDHPFTGTVVGYKRGSPGEGIFIQVKDMDDDIWDCCPEQISHNTDGILHADSCGHLTDL